MNYFTYWKLVQTGILKESSRNLLIAGSHFLGFENMLTVKVVLLAVDF